MISIYTFTLGRTYYLDRLIASVIESARSYPGVVEHHICFQGVTPAESTLTLVRNHGVKSLRFEVHEWPQNLGIAVGMNRIIPALDGEMVIKMDDDCLIHSRGFFEHVEAVAELKPTAFFSPFPAGLLGKVVGGVPGSRRSVGYSPKTDTYYTFRPVSHLGGLCRISPARLVRGWVLEPDLLRGGSGSEDTQYSARCRREGIDMYYLENALIVEHQETALGQGVRYKQYFRERFPDEFEPHGSFVRAWVLARRSAGRALRRLGLRR